MGEPGQSTYNPPGLRLQPYLTGGGNQVNGVKVYEVKKLFSIANQDWLLTNGVTRTFMNGAGGWQDPVTGLTSFFSMAKLPARPGQYWRVKWKARLSVEPRGNENSQLVTLGFRITNPTSGTEDYLQDYRLFPDPNKEVVIEAIVSPQTSETASFQDDAPWTRIKCIGTASGSGTTSGIRLSNFNEITLQLWNGPFPRTNRQRNANPFVTSYEVQPQDL